MLDGAERIHVALSDDAAVDAVLESIRDAVPAGTWIVDHTTTAPGPTAERAARWTARGRVYLHAPVFMGPKNAEDGTGLMLVSGDPGRIATVLPFLEAMTSKVLPLGPKPETAAAYKLFGNLAILGFQGLAGDVARLAAAVGITPTDAMTLFAEFNPGRMFPDWAAKVANGPYDPPSFTASMARKDVRLMLEEAARHGVELAVMPAVARVYDAALARGEGDLDTTAAFRVVSPRAR